MVTRTILVADDDTLLRESLCDLLGGMGVDTRQAGNGGGAIEILSHHAFDLVLSDVDMPDMTGFALLAWIQAHRPVPSVLMSARADRQLDVAALQAGALALLPKPVSADRLTRLVRQVLAGGFS
ncbi:MAG: response regulator [Planctomycetes bacterium]|nr:response regulator [Planctomycetota bacterium]